MDEIDLTDERTAKLLEADVALIRQRAQTIEPGKAGECDKCGEVMPRIVKGVCCRCRDKLGLP